MRKGWRLCKIVDEEGVLHLLEIFLRALLLSKSYLAMVHITWRFRRILWHRWSGKHFPLVAINVNVIMHGLLCADWLGVTSYVVFCKNILSWCWCCRCSGSVTENFCYFLPSISASLDIRSLRTLNLDNQRRKTLLLSYRIYLHHILKFRKLIVNQ
jgi:hypothetical protein